jgi:hypothetical protein
MAGKMVQLIAQRADVTHSPGLIHLKAGRQTAGSVHATGVWHP